jgi:hypothetical protein
MPPKNSSGGRTAGRSAQTRMITEQRMKAKEMAVAEPTVKELQGLLDSAELRVQELENMVQRLESALQAEKRALADERERFELLVEEHNAVVEHSEQLYKNL